MTLDFRQGQWGLESCYCQMIGGEAEIVQPLDPIFRALAPGRRAPHPRSFPPLTAGRVSTPLWLRMRLSAAHG
jgi:6-phosphogluconate dehydrogenase (decarboxylating)